MYYWAQGTQIVEEVIKATGVAEGDMASLIMRTGGQSAADRCSQGHASGSGGLRVPGAGRRYCANRSSSCDARAFEIP